MPSERGEAHIQKEQVGSYAARWLKLSRDDVPQASKPPRPNSVVLAIMTNGNSTNGQAGNHQHSAPERTRSEPGS